MDDKQPVQMESIDKQAIPVDGFENYSYSVDYQVKAEGDWVVEFEFNEGRPFCYAMPARGHGNQTIKLCLVDNPNAEANTGEMIITDFAHPDKPVTVQLKQKGISMTRAGEAKEMTKGWRIYGVGYGFNALTNEIARNPICMMDSLSQDGLLTKDAIKLEFMERHYTGSCYSELTNNLKAEAKFSGEYSGFKGEVDACFDNNIFKENKYEYALGLVDVAVQKANIEADLNAIIGDYMTDAAYLAINGLDYTSKKGRKVKTQYKSNREGFHKLIKEFGTHMLVSAKLGGRLKYATTIDVSNVENSYDLNAFAKCSYKNKFIDASGSVSDSLKQSVKENSKSVSVKVLASGGGDNEALALKYNDCDANIEAWVNTLKSDKNKTVVNVPEAQMVPLYDLVTEDDDRQLALKEYMTSGQMEEDFKSEEVSETEIETGTITHIMGIPTFNDKSSDATLVKDIDEGGRLVARACNEVIPQIDRTNRVTVIYPVIGSWAKYNMGYFVGNSTCKPQRVCWNRNGSVKITPVDGASVGRLEALYMRGSSFYTANDEIIKESKELKVVADIKCAYMEGKSVFTEWGVVSKSGGKMVNNRHNYPIVKIFNLLWSREDMSEITSSLSKRCELNTAGNGVVYSSEEVKYMSDKFGANWRAATQKDFQDLMDGLKNNNFSNIGKEVIGDGLTGLNIFISGKEKVYLPSDGGGVMARPDGTFRSIWIDDTRKDYVRVVQPIYRAN